MNPPSPPDYIVNPKIYFTEKTDEAIVRYNEETDPKIKSKIYQTEIHYSFYKLTQNLIHTFKFYNTEVDNLEDLQHEVILFLLSKIHKFNPDLGYKAYSYFGLIAKRYLIIEDTKNYKKKVNSIPLVDINNHDGKDEDYNAYSLSPIEKEKLLSPPEEVEGPEDKMDHLSEYIDSFTTYCLENLEKLIPHEKLDQQIADAILELFIKREHIKIFNKKALYINIRERVDVKAPKITKIAKYLHNIFKDEYSFYLDHGYYKFKEPHIYNKKYYA